MKALMVVVLLLGCGARDDAVEFRDACKAKGGVVVTNTRALAGEPSYVCVKPL